MNLERFTRPTHFFDYESELVQNFINGIELKGSKKEQAIQLFYAIRDAFIYDPYQLVLTSEGLKASSTLKKKRAWCVEKATLMIACCRAIGIPARPGYAIVTNHIGVERLTEILRSDKIVFHGYADLYLEGKWVKATPSFDERICRLANVAPLDFNGEDDCLFQEFENEGNQFMEYVHEYGVFDDVPIHKMNAEMKKYYPHLFDEIIDFKKFKFIPHPDYINPSSAKL